LRAQPVASRPSDLATAKARTRVTWTTFAAVACGSTSLYAAFTAAPLVATEPTGLRAVGGGTREAAPEMLGGPLQQGDCYSGRFLRTERRSRYSSSLISPRA
jgi:hypothetical protein